MQVDVTHKRTREEEDPFLSSKMPCTSISEKTVQAALNRLEQIASEFNSTNIAHLDFIVNLRKGFEGTSDLGILDEKIQQLLFCSHLKFKSAAIEQYRDKIDWESLPFDESLYSKCDVTFLVGSERTPIPAHCINLMEYSEFFTVLLAGGQFTESSEKRAVVLPDVFPNTFLNYLTCVYKWEFPKKMNDLVRLAIFSHGKEEDIFKKTIKRIRQEIKTLSPDEKVDYFKECFSFPMLGNIFSDVVAPMFHKLGFEVFSPIELFLLLKSDHLSYNEIELFDVLNSWEKSQVNPNWLVEEIPGYGRLIDCVRFERLSTEQFVEIHTHLPLSDLEKQKIYNMIITRSLPELNIFNYEYRSLRGLRIDEISKDENVLLLNVRIPFVSDEEKISRFKINIFGDEYVCKVYNTNLVIDCRSESPIPIKFEIQGLGRTLRVLRQCESNAVVIHDSPKLLMRDNFIELKIKAEHESSQNGNDSDEELLSLIL